MNAMLISANDSNLVPVTGERRIDAVAVRRVIHDHACKIGCDTSNRDAALAWALRYGTCTLDACRQGKQRAEKLRAQQPSATPPAPVAA